MDNLIFFIWLLEKLLFHVRKKNFINIWVGKYQMTQKFFENNDIDKKKFSKYLDKKIKLSNSKYDSFIKQIIKGLDKKFLQPCSIVDKGTLKTLEYFLDQKLYKKSITAIKEAMDEKAIPYDPL